MMAKGQQETVSGTNLCEAFKRLAGDTLGSLPEPNHKGLMEGLSRWLDSLPDLPEPIHEELAELLEQPGLELIELPAGAVLTGLVVNPEAAIRPCRTPRRRCSR